MSDYTSLLPPLSTEEREALEADIAERGILVPVVLDDETGDLLDGNHRREIGEKLGVEVPERRMAFASDVEREAFALSHNLSRRNLSFEQRRDLRKHQQRVYFALRDDHTQARAAAKVGVSRSTAANWDAERDASNVRSDKASGDPEKKAKKNDKRIKITDEEAEDIARRVELGEPHEQIAADYGISRQRVGQIAKKAKAKAETAERRKRSREAEPLDDGVDLRIGDARDVLADVEDESAALVLTDPPYGDEAEPLYRWLAEWSARVLVSGGSLICFTGQSRLDRDMRVFGEQLRYWWCLSMPHHQSQRLAGKFVIIEWKPVLWFVKDHRRGRTLVPDVLRSPAREKADHPWGQGDGGIAPLLEHLTEPGELVCDPFAGTGRWGQMTASMGRRWIGADVEAGGTAQVVA